MNSFLSHFCHFKFSRFQFFEYRRVSCITSILVYLVLTVLILSKVNFIISLMTMLRRHDFVHSPTLCEAQALLLTKKYYTLLQTELLPSYQVITAYSSFSKLSRAFFAKNRFSVQIWRNSDQYVVCTPDIDNSQ